MRHTKRKITKIIDELLTYCYSIDATNIIFHIEETIEYHNVSIRCNFDDYYRSQVETLQTKLSIGRRPEIEELYWNLTGMSDMNDEAEFLLISAMIDQVNVKINDNEVIIDIKRKRSKKI